MAPGKGPLRIAVEDFLTGFGFGPKINAWTKNLLEDFESEAIDAYAYAINALGIQDELPAQYQPAALRRMVQHPIGLLLILAPIIWSVIQDITRQTVGVFLRPIGYALEGLAHNRRLDPNILVAAIIRNPKFTANFNKYFREHGLDDESFQAMALLAERRLSSAEYMAAERRGVLPPESVNLKLHQEGVPAEDVDTLRALNSVIPSPGDLVQMAVREAWNEQTVSQFKYDAGFQEISEAVSWMKKQGLSEDFAKRYWRAHWQLPGINQVYEMLHRLRGGDLETNLDTVSQYLKTADIPEYWRDRLIAISYAPYTRIDIRRMWKMHILTEDEVYQAHRDIGYDDEHARKLTQFVVEDQTSDKVDLSRAAVLQAYKRGVVSRSDAKTSLMSIGLSDDEAEYYLHITDYDIEAEKTDVQLSVIQARYVNGLIAESELAQQLGKLNLPSDRSTALETIWSIQRNNKVATPARSDLDDLLRRDIITHEQYQATLKLDGYAQETIDWYVKRIDEIIANDAASELEQKQAEQERLKSAVLRNQYQIDRADDGVQIAQLKSAIADIILASHTITDPDQLKKMLEDVTKYKNQIVHLQQDMATLYSKYLESLPKPKPPEPT